MLLITSLVLALSFPSNSKTSWMRPESFRLTIGMSKSEAMSTLNGTGWDIEDRGETVNVEYDGNKALTLEFTKDRLYGVRFELFGLIPDIRKAFDEERAFLKEKLGDPKKAGRSATIVIYDSTLPNIMMVASTETTTENGKKGIGRLLVRYFDPLAKK
jgi:hypothetical protein